MDALPAPLTPPECDLQDFKFMPLHVARLRDSDLAAEAEPEACWYAVLLWAISWHQLPAASLPDNDAVLTKLLGLGRDVRTFAKHKAAALRGFVKCSDGRLYHPVVAEAAVDAWTGKLKQRWATECARIKKHNQRTGQKLLSPTFEQFISGDVPVPGPEIVPEDTGECPQGNDVQGTGKGTETGNKREESIDPSLAASAPAARLKSGKTIIPKGYPDAAAIAEAQGWIAEAGVKLDADVQSKRFRSHALSNSRKLADWAEGWRGWIDIACEDAPKVVAAAPATEAPIIWDGPQDIWDRCVANMGEAKTRTYLGRCTWRAEPPGILARTRIAADHLARAGLGAPVIPPTTGARK